MNKLSTGDFAIGCPNSDAREKEWKEISEREAVQRLGLPENHDYGKDSSASKFVAAFVEGAEWQRKNPS